MLAISWALAALRPKGPFPILVVTGEHGTAKSTTAAIMKALIDPNTATKRSLSREERDLFISALNMHVQAFDNISSLSPWMSDALCRLATGGAFVTRELYTDLDETLIDAVRPIVLNGIEDFVTRPDLADRSVFIELEKIAEDQRKAESQLWSEFEKVRPGIIGALLTAVSRGLRELPTTKLDKPPRMADFAIWVTACEPAIWAKGTFAKAYRNNANKAVDGILDGDPVAVAIKTLMSMETEWESTASLLLVKLEQLAGDRAVRDKDWPKGPRALSNHLKRITPPLRTIGIEVKRLREGGTGDRMIRITLAAEREGKSSSQSSQSSQDGE